MPRGGEGYGNRALERAAALLTRGKAVALTGAGISADSGVPTFRGEDGLWRRYRPEELATPEAFQKDPGLVWEWYSWRIEMIKKARPNAGHVALAEMVKLGLVECVVTQNVDDLHERACTPCVVKLHGNIMVGRCTSCGFRVRWEDVPKGVPRCPQCGSAMRPDVVWFGEALPEEALTKAIELFSRADVALVIGTSGVVRPAADLPLITKEKGGYLIEINPEPTALTPYADVVIRERASVALPKLLDMILEALRVRGE
ncbi:MAG: NAD-dependent deacylase [Crenarchaeota archaeon]|nr:NAD-dependent deacylase [Thermoproteota archaeon]